MLHPEFDAKNEEFKKGRIPYTVYLTQEQIDYLPPIEGSQRPELEKYHLFTKSYRANDDGFPIPESDGNSRFDLWHKVDEYGQIDSYKISVHNSYDYSQKGWTRLGVYDSRPLAKQASKELAEGIARDRTRAFKDMMSDDEMEARLSGLDNMNIPNDERDTAKILRDLGLD